MRSLFALLMSIGLVGGCGFAGDFAAEADGGSSPGTGTGGGTNAATGSGGSEEFSSPTSANAEDRLAADVLLAGEWDDGLNFTWYLQYLETYLGYRDDVTVDVTGRRVIIVENELQEPVANVSVEVPGEGPNGLVPVGMTATNGQVQVFPTHDQAKPLDPGLTVTVDVPGLGPQAIESQATELEDGSPAFKVVLPLASSAPPIDLDIAIVIDATFSLEQEIGYLASQIEAIDEAIAPSIGGGGSVRYALVAYRDTVGDDDTNVTEVTGFGETLEPVSTALGTLEAEGGGDYPEAVERGLGDALDLKWREGNVARMAFIIGDAPAHEDKLATLNDLSEEARQRGIRLYPVGASGTGDRAQFYFRQAALMTLGRYLFLTTDTASGDLVPAETNGIPIGTMPCYRVQNLSNIMVRMIKSELSGQREPALDGNVYATLGAPDETGTCTFTESVAFTSPLQP